MEVFHVDEIFAQRLELVQSVVLGVRVQIRCVLRAAALGQNLFGEEQLLLLVAARGQLLQMTACTILLEA